MHFLRKLSTPLPIHSFLSLASKHYPERIATIFHGNQKTFREYDEKSEKLAGYLAGIIEKGERVAIYLQNSPEFIISFYAILKAGGIVTPIRYLYTRDEIEYILKDSGARAIMTAAGEGGKLEEIEKAKVDLIYVDRIEGKRAELPEIELDDPACLLYTSGTTGKPKGVLSLHINHSSNILQHAKTMTEFEWMLAEEGNVRIHVTPFSSAMGCFHGIELKFALATTSIIFERFSPPEYLEAVQKYHATELGGPPSLFRSLLDHPEVGKYDLSSVKIIRMGGSPVPDELKKEVRRIFRNAKVWVGYGMTEASTGILHTPKEYDLLEGGSSGIPYPETEIKIVDPSTKKELPPGEKGEIAVRGPQIMKEYWKLPELTAEVLRDGWLYTGDVGYTDGKYYYVIGRKDDLLIYKGYNIYPEEIEKVIERHPNVEKCAVIGISDKMAGEIPFALVVAKNLSEGELMRFANERLAPYKKVRRMKFVKEIPSDSLGKINRKELRKIYKGE